MSRYISALLITALLSPSLASAADRGHEVTRAASSRLRHASVAIELTTGEVIEGQLEKVDRKRLRVQRDGSVSTVRLTDIRSVTDRKSGDRFELQPTPTARMPKPGHTSLKAWLIAGAIVGAFLLWLVVAFPAD